MRTKWAVLTRVLGVILLLVVGLGSSWGRIHPVLAEAPAQGSQQAGPAGPVPVEVTLGEPVEINMAPKESTPEAEQAAPSIPPPERPDRTLANTPDSYWTIMMQETFEGIWPDGQWFALDGDGTINGEYYWDDDDFKPYNEYWSAWAANGGANGLDPQYNNYPNYVDSWMVYGPFDLSNCAAADFEFYYWNKSESGYDYFQWLSSPNGSNFYGWGISGDSGGWQWVDETLVPYLGDSSVWLAFRFTSDYTVTDVGAFVDDVILWCLTDTTTVSWTYMVYLDGDNNLEAAAIDDFLEMSSVGSSANVDIVVQFDRITGFSTAYDDWTDTKRYHVAAGMTPTAANAITGIGETNMGDPETLLNFIRWGRAAYPATNYAVVLWDHGSGWTLRDPDDILTKGIAYDDSSGGDAIDMPELRSVLSTFTGTGTNPIELFGMDACLMAMVEVDNQIKPYADVRVGSQETEPADGWPHDTILTGLVANPGWTASQLATRIVDDYYTSYGNNQTQSAANLGSLYTSLNTATNNFAQALITWAPYYRTEITDARNIAQTFSTTTYIDLWDFADWVSIYASSNTDLYNTASAVETAVLSAVIREQSGASWPWAQGISVYFPKTAGEYDARYDGSSGFLQFTGSTQWDEWVRMYHVLGNYPANFNKSSPANGATDQLLSLTLAWAASTGATSYQYCYDTTNDNACTSWVSTGSLTSATIGVLAPSTTYYWQVRALNATGTLYANMAPTAYWSFTTGLLPGTFSKSSPASGATSVSLTPTLSWGSSSNATLYQYCYDTTNDNACSTWIGNGASTSVTLPTLASGTTYYWHVRASNTIGTMYSNSSATAFWSFTTGSPPAAFDKSSPANGATFVSMTPTLSWGSASGATSYEYCYDTTNDNACSGWTNNGTSTSAGVSLTYGMTYYWHVRANNSFGTTYANGAATAFWSFTTGYPPGSFNKTSPANGATNQPVSLTLSWGDSTYAASYEYCIDTTNDTACSTWVSTGTNTSAAIGPLNYGTIYYWQVRALNGFGTTYANGGSTAFWSFTTGSLPGVFSKSLPANGATGQLSSVTLTWEASSGATSYTFCIDTSNDGACEPFLNIGNQTSTTLVGLLPSTVYYWHVAAYNSMGTTYSNGSTTAFWSFTTGPLPGAFSKVSPSNGALDQPLSLSLSWGSSTEASSYEYCYDTANNNACDGVWMGTGLNTSAVISGLLDNTIYYWQARALNTFGSMYANSEIWWSFTTMDVPVYYTFMPLIKK